jgi:lysophospholipase L1-like esterase
MQKSRRRCRLEQRLLPVSRAFSALLLAAACAHGGGAGQSAGAAAVAESSTTAGGEHDSVADQTNPSDALAKPGDTSPAGKTAGAGDAPPSDLPRGSLVLHVGDSFAGALGVPLARRLKAAGLRSVLEFRTSSYVPEWASGTELPGYVARYNPDLVIVTLGANEFDLQNPAQRAGAVRRLVRELGGRPCVWVSPPRWKADSGILAVIHENVKPCRFLDSDTIVHDLERKRDGIHPSDAAREIWADAVLAWLVRERRGGAERPWELKEEQP